MNVRRFDFFVLAPSVVVVMVGGCYASESAPNDEATLQTKNDYVSAYAEVEADLVGSCCEQIGLSGAAEDYAEQVERGLSLSLPDPAAGARFDPEGAAACVAAIRAEGCELLKAPHETASACGDVYVRGHARLGDPCRSVYDCALADGELTSCEATVVRGEVVRRCVRVVLAAEGESCAGRDTTAVHCAGDLLCDDRSNTCERRAARGEPCLTGPAWGDTCEIGSVCDRNGTRRCVEPTPVGEPCEPIDNLCEGFACIAGTCREPFFRTSTASCAE